MFGLSGIFGPSVGNGNYYYGRLTDEQKSLYRTILSGIDSFTKEIKLPLRPVNEVLTIFNSVLLDNPMIFYVSSFNQANDLYKQKCIMRPDYKYAQHFVRQNTNHIRSYLQVFDAQKTKSDVEKEIYVHDYCLNNFSYDYTFSDYSFSILGPVLNRTSVCEGIAKFVKLSLDYLGINTLVAHGRAKDPTNNQIMEMHAWNVVLIDGKTYHLDVTFDMTLKDKVNRYDYFNLADEDVKEERTMISDLPPCTTAGKDYCSVNALVAYSPSELNKFIEHNLKRGKKNIIVKLKNVKSTETIVDKVISIAQNQYASIYKHSVRVEVKYNQSQLVFEINFK